MTEQKNVPVDASNETGAITDNELPGRILREEREARSLSLRQAASELHVDSFLLDALEHDDFDRIGAPIFVKGHLRNYARLLGLDPQPLVEAYERKAPGEPPAIVTRQTDGAPMEVNSGGPWLKAFGWVLLILLLLGSIGWWYYQQEASSIGTSTTLQMLGSDASTATESAGSTEPATTSPDISSDVPAEDPRARLVTPEGDEQAASDPGVAGMPDAGVVESNEQAPASDEPVAGGDIPAVESVEETSVETRVASETPPERQAASSSESGTLLLRFSEASWVEVYNAAEEALLYDLVPAGSTRRVSADGELRVFLGNAPAVTIEMNGEPFDMQRYVRRDNTARFSVDPSATQ